jgi:hypothetical protein
MNEKEIFIYKGKKYCRYLNAKNRSDRVYFKKGKKYLHRIIYEDTFGPIPDNAHIHHKDKNPGNNDLDNLVCVTVKEHWKYHPIEGDRLKKHLEHLEKIRPLTVAWHSSEAGKKLHEKLAENFEKARHKHSTCKHCNSEFITDAGYQFFCSNKCKSAWRRKEKLDNIKKICPLCKKDFSSNKYAKIIFCSKKCAQQSRIKLIDKICIHCKSPFQTKKSIKTKYCSFACYQLYRKTI